MKIFLNDVYVQYSLVHCFIDDNDTKNEWIIKKLLNYQKVHLLPHTPASFGGIEGLVLIEINQTIIVLYGDWKIKYKKGGLRHVKFAFDFYPMTEVIPIKYFINHQQYGEVIMFFTNFNIKKLW